MSRDKGGIAYWTFIGSAVIFAGILAGYSHVAARERKLRDFNLIAEPNQVGIITKYDANNNQILETSELANLLNDYRLEEIK